MEIDLEVYSNGQWTNRNDPKGCYVVRGTIPALRSFVERWRERDRVLDATGMMEYHVFYTDPYNNLTREDRDALGDELYDFEVFLHPADFEICVHGLSAQWCVDPVNHYDPRF